MIEFLFVGDNENLFQYLRLKDQHLKYIVSNYPDLKSALKHLNAARSCIMFIDNDYTQEISCYFISVARKLNRKLHIIVLTGDDSLNNIRDIKEKSINDIMLKPLDKDRFELVINKAILKVS